MIWFFKNLLFYVMNVIILCSKYNFTWSSWVFIKYITQRSVGWLDNLALLFNWQQNELFKVFYYFLIIFAEILD